MRFEGYRTLSKLEFRLLRSLERRGIISPSRLGDGPFSLRIYDVTPLREALSRTKGYRERKTDEILVGIVVPKRVGKATVRNKLRRRVRGILVEVPREIKWRLRAYVIIVLVKETARDKSFEELKEAILSSLKELPEVDFC